MPAAGGEIKPAQTFPRPALLSAAQFAERAARRPLSARGAAPSPPQLSRSRVQASLDFSTIPVGPLYVFRFYSERKSWQGRRYWILIPEELRPVFANSPPERPLL